MVRKTKHWKIWIVSPSFSFSFPSLVYFQIQVSVCRTVVSLTINVLFIWRWRRANSVRGLTFGPLCRVLTFWSNPLQNFVSLDEKRSSCSRRNHYVGSPASRLGGLEVSYVNVIKEVGRPRPAGGNSRINANRRVRIVYAIMSNPLRACLRRVFNLFTQGETSSLFYDL